MPVADVPIAIMPNSGKITLLQMDGEIKKEELMKLIEISKKVLMNIYEMQKKALKERYKEVEV